MITISKNKLEAVKEIARWIILFILSWIVTQVLAQINVLPELLNIKIWLFSFIIPLQNLVTFLLTLVGRYLDKLVYLNSKDLTSAFDLEVSQKAKGLLPF